MRKHEVWLCTYPLQGGSRNPVITHAGMTIKMGHDGGTPIIVVETTLFEFIIERARLTEAKLVALHRLKQLPVDYTLAPPPGTTADDVRQAALAAIDADDFDLALRLDPWAIVTSVACDVLDHWRKQLTLHELMTVLAHIDQQLIADRVDAHMAGRRDAKAELHEWLTSA